MTPDRLRQLADAADKGCAGETWPDGLDAGHDWSYYVEENGAALIAALGPDAARLLADAMDALRRLRHYTDPDVAALLARFAALGEEGA